MKEIDLKKQSPILNIILFFATFITTSAAGASFLGYNVFKDPNLIYKGFSYSFPLLIILGCHEFGHYYYAMKHRVEASLPYFIPVPTFIGTFGAFIRLKQMIPTRRALIEIGAAGPFASFILSIIAIIIGFGLIPDLIFSGESGGRPIRLMGHPLALPLGLIRSDVKVHPLDIMCPLITPN